MEEMNRLLWKCKHKKLISIGFVMRIYISHSQATAATNCTIILTTSDPVTVGACVSNAVVVRLSVSGQDNSKPNDECQGQPGSQVYSWTGNYLSSTNQATTTFSNAWTTAGVYTNPVTAMIKFYDCLSNLTCVATATANVIVTSTQLKSQTFANPLGLDRARTTVGVGEDVNLTLAPPPLVPITWNVDNGGILITNGTSAQFTAPPTGTTSTVTANLGNGVTISKPFIVKEPTGFALASIRNTNPMSYYSGGYPTGGVFSAGGFMQLDVWIAPRTVSFYKVSLREENIPASNIQGVYFLARTNSIPTELDHISTTNYLPLNFANYWGPDNCGVKPFGWVGPWQQGGSFQWQIPISWFAEGGPTNTIPLGWIQVFTLDASGTVSVSKFGQTVTRGTNGVVTISP